MKKIRLLIIIIISLIFISCSEENNTSSIDTSIIDSSTDDNTSSSKPRSNANTNKFIIGRVGDVTDVCMFPSKLSSWMDVFHYEDIIPVLDELIGEETTLYLMTKDEEYQTSNKDIKVHVWNSSEMFLFYVNKDGTLYYLYYQTGNAVMYRTAPGYSDYEALVKHFTCKWNF